MASLGRNELKGTVPSQVKPIVLMKSSSVVTQPIISRLPTQDMPWFDVIDKL